MTIKSYLEALRLFAAHQGGTDVLEATRTDVKSFIVEQLEPHKPATAAAVQVGSFRVADRYQPDGRAQTAAGARGPRPDRDGRESAEAAHGVRRHWSGTRRPERQEVEYFAARRDEAMIRLMLDPGGMRLDEIAAVAADGVDIESDVVVVRGKGDRMRAIPFGVRTGQALSRYLRLRPAHTYAQQPALWLAQKGGITPSGVQQMLERRCALAGTREFMRINCGTRPVAMRHPRCGCLAGGPDRCRSATERLDTVGASRIGKHLCEHLKLEADRLAGQAVRSNPGTE